MAIDRNSLVAGRYAAWVCGLSFVMSLALFVLIQVGVIAVSPPPVAGRGDPVEYLAYVEAAGPFRQLGGGLWLLGLLSLAPIGFSLRRYIGGGITADFMAASFAGSAVAATIWGVVYIGGIDAVMQGATAVPAEMAGQLVLLELYVWQALEQALLAGTFLLAASGALLTAALAWTSDALPRGWGVLSSVLGTVLLAGVAGFMLGSGEFLSLVQGVAKLVLLPAWAFWLARTSGRPGLTVAGDFRTPGGPEKRRIASSVEP